MQITWLDLLAANMGAMLWLWCLVTASRQWRTERKKFIPAFITCSMIAIGLTIFCARAGYWYEYMLAHPTVLVPEVATQ